MWSFLPEVEGEPNLDTTSLTNRSLRMSVSVHSVESSRPVGVFLPDDSDVVRSDLDDNDSGVRCKLIVEKLGRIAVKLREQKFGCLKIAILGNASSTTSVAVLLEFSEVTRHYKRITVLEVKRLSPWKYPEIIFIK
jgi:hypothetical protein